MRYFCHHCHTNIAEDELLPNFTCPSCRSGFIEELPSVVSSLGQDPARRSSSQEDSSLQFGPDIGIAGFFSTRMSNEDLSDDNSDVEFLDAVNGPLAQVFNLFQPHVQAVADDLSLPRNSGQQPTPGDSAGPQTADAAQSQQTPSQANRRLTRAATAAARMQGGPSGAGPGASSLPTGSAAQASPYSTNQSLADVLNDFMTGATFGGTNPDANRSGIQVASGSGTNSANRGLINIDFPIPFFLHSNPGDYAWGNAGFDAVITQLLNNLDGSNTGPPPMPREQINTLPSMKITEENVKETSDQCTVCMDDFHVGEDAKRLPCDHFFHRDCILPWLELHASCPVCRKTFTASGAQPNVSDSQHTATLDLSVNAATATSGTTTSSATMSAPTSRNIVITTTASTTTSTTSTVNPSSTGPMYDFTQDECD